MFNPLRLFSFSDWNRNHPSDQPPGDRLDEAFDSTARAIQDVDYKLGELRRSDGALNNHIVTHDSLSPSLVGVLTSEIRATLQNDLETVKSLASGIASAQFLVSKEAEKAGLAAHAAAEKARFVEDRLPALLSTVGRSTDVAYELLGRVEARAADIVNDANDAQYWGNYAYSWGQVSYNWAEYMAGPIPPDILATMGISGNHWSSRWWANEATIAVGDAEDWAQQAADSAASAAAALDQMTDLYLGPHPSNPTVDNDGNPLQVGAIYYNTSDHNMYVWTGTVWAVSNNSQGWVPEAPIDSHTYVRGNASWLQSAGGVADAPNDGKAYARKSVNWSQLTSDDMLFGAGPGMVTGAINLKASQASLDTETAARIAGDQANLSTIQGLKASQVANDSSVTGATVKDALNTTAAGIASNTSAIALKADISAMNLKAPIDNPVFTGDPRAPTPPAADNDTSIPTTAWVNTAVSGALALKPSVIVNATPPASPIDNAMWWESDTGYLFLRYNDGNSAQWVQLNGIPTALQANYVARAGDTMTGTLTVAPGSGPAQVILNKAVNGVGSSVQGQLSGKARWGMVLGNGAAESGANVGNDFAVTRYDDSGAYIDAPFSINRATGAVAIMGVTDGSNALPGQIGEVISSTVTTNVPMAQTTATNITSVLLTPGDWDISGEAWVTPTAATGNAIVAGLNITSANLPAQPSTFTSRAGISVPNIATGPVVILPLRTCRASLTANVTYYLVAQINAAAANGMGTILARRVR
jgi:hypothetical protein